MALLMRANGCTTWKPVRLLMDQYEILNSDCVYCSVPCYLNMLPLGMFPTGSRRLFIIVRHFLLLDLLFPSHSPRKTNQSYIMKALLASFPFSPAFLSSSIFSFFPFLFALFCVSMPLLKASLLHESPLIRLSSFPCSALCRLSQLRRDSSSVVKVLEIESVALNWQELLKAHQDCSH